MGNKDSKGPQRSRDQSHNNNHNHNHNVTRVNAPYVAPITPPVIQTPVNPLHASLDPLFKQYLDLPWPADSFRQGPFIGGYYEAIDVQDASQSKYVLGCPLLEREAVNRYYDDEVLHGWRLRSLFGALHLDCLGVVLLMKAGQVNTPVQLTFLEFVRAWQHYSPEETSIEALAASIQLERENLLQITEAGDVDVWLDVYRAALPILQELRSVRPNHAVAFMRAFVPLSRFPIRPIWCDYILWSKKGLSKDVWQVFPEFVIYLQVSGGASYSSEDAWPLYYDEFMEYSQCCISDSLRSTCIRRVAQLLLKCPESDRDAQLALLPMELRDAVLQILKLKKTLLSRE